MIAASHAYALPVTGTQPVDFARDDLDRALAAAARDRSTARGDREELP
jgi:hypothetical protein